jgi:hypothetical protein
VRPFACHTQLGRVCDGLRVETQMCGGLCRYNGFQSRDTARRAAPCTKYTHQTHVGGRSGEEGEFHWSEGKRRANKAVLPSPTPDLNQTSAVGIMTTIPSRACSDMSQAMFSCRNQSKFVPLAPPCPPGIRKHTGGGLYTGTCGAYGGLQCCLNFVLVCRVRTCQMDKRRRR